MSFWKKLFGSNESEPSTQLREQSAEMQTDAKHLARLAAYAVFLHSRNVPGFTKENQDAAMIASKAITPHLGMPFREFSRLVAEIHEEAMATGVTEEMIEFFKQHCRLPLKYEHLCG